jgi:NMD protein affecting ribosome stability and mRNA decay
MIVDKVITCPDCGKEIHGARYFIREVRKWICESCYFKDE